MLVVGLGRRPDALVCAYHVCSTVVPPSAGARRGVSHVLLRCGAFRAVAPCVIGVVPRAEVHRPGAVKVKRCFQNEVCLMAFVGLCAVQTPPLFGNACSRANCIRPLGRVRPSYNASPTAPGERCMHNRVISRISGLRAGCRRVCSKGQTITSGPHAGDRLRSHCPKSRLITCGYRTCGKRPQKGPWNWFQAVGHNGRRPGEVARGVVPPAHLEIEGGTRTRLNCKRPLPGAGAIRTTESRQTEACVALTAGQRGTRGGGPPHKSHISARGIDL